MAALAAPSGAAFFTFGDQVTRSGRIKADLRVAYACAATVPLAWRNRIVARWIYDREPRAGESAQQWKWRRREAWNTLETMVDRCHSACIKSTVAGNEYVIGAASNDDQLCDVGERMTAHCRAALGAGGDWRRAVAVRDVLAVVESWRIDTGALKPEQVCARAIDEKWWRRKLRRVHTLAVERAALAMGIVGQGRDKYCSRESARLWHEREARTREWMESVTLECAADCQRRTIAELHDGSVAHLPVRRAELDARIHGIEEICSKDRGLDCLFVTITCPSKFHPMRWRVDGSSEPNPRWCRASPRDAQAHLNVTWRAITRELDRRKIGITGLRVAEPHHDGTPHWHMLVWCARNVTRWLTELIRRVALKVDGYEPGAAQSRCKAERIDPRKGSAAAYIAKYLSKNLPGTRRENSSPQQSALMPIAENQFNRVITGISADNCREKSEIPSFHPLIWARVWGIRQFQFFGTAPVTLWRVGRRLAHDGWLDLSLTIALHRNRDLATFVNYAVWLRAVERYGFTLLRCWSDRLNRYREPVGWLTIGLYDSIGKDYHLPQREWRAVSRAVCMAS